MTKYMIAFAAATLAAAPAFAETMTRDGVTYLYTVAQQGDVKVISGKDTTSGNDFTFRVAHGRVEGLVAGRPVDFSLSDVKVSRAHDNREVAAR